MRHHIIRVERVTHWGKGVRPRTHYSIILLFLHTLFQSNCVPCPAFYTWLQAPWGRGHLLAAFVQPLKQWGHVLEEEEFLHARDADDARMLMGRAKELSPAEMLLHSRAEGLFACLTYSKSAGVWSWPSKEYVREILQPDSSFLCPQRCFHIGKASPA